MRLDLRQPGRTQELSFLASLSLPIGSPTSPAVTHDSARGAGYAKNALHPPRPAIANPN
jgi:hypothetical protein